MLIEKLLQLQRHADINLAFDGLARSNFGKFVLN